MSKKFLTLFSLVLVASFILTSCSGAPTQATTAAPAEATTVATTAPVTTDAATTEPVARHLTIWHAYAGQQDKVDFINWAMAGFKAKYPDIQIDEVPMEHSAYKTKLTTAMAAGNPPDVFYTLPGGYLGQFAQSGQVYELDDELAKDGWGDSFIPSTLKAVQFNGKTFGVPIDMDAVVVWYNKKLFETHGWTTPETWDEFLALGEQIKAAGIVPVALGNKDSWPATFWFQFFELRLAGTGIVDKFNAGDSTASFDPQGIVPLQLMADLAKKGFFPTGFNGMTDSEANMLFMNGQAAMNVTGTWEIGAVAEAPKDTFDLGFFSFPTFSNGVDTQTDVIAGVAAAFAISQSCANKADAVLFLKHLTSKEVMAKYVEIRKTPVDVKDATTETVAGPVLYGIMSQVLQPAASLDSFYDTAMPPAAMQVYYTVLQGVLDGSITPADGAKQLNDAMKAGK